MPDPARLPLELFKIITDFVVESKEDMKSLCSLSLVSRTWHTIHVPQLYMKYTYDGDIYSFVSLWKYLRTMLNNRQLAETVRALDIRHWGVHADSIDDDGNSALVDEDITAVHEAMHAAGMQKLASDVEAAVRHQDRRLLMALLLTLLPNVTSLDAHTPWKDHYLAEVLRLSIADRETKPQRQALQNLESAQIMSESHMQCYRYLRDLPRDNYVLEFQHIWPIFRLPNVRNVSVFDFDLKDASELLVGCAGTSSLTHLTVVVHKDVHLSAPDAIALLTLPKALTSLSLYFNDCRVLPDSDLLQISNEDLWLGLQPHSGSLEYLDLYRDCTGVVPPIHRPNNGHFGLLSNFIRLTQLCIQPETLLGGCMDDEPLAAFPLQDTLPPTLKSFTFYGDMGILRNERLGDQTCEVLRSSTFARITSLFIEDVSPINSCFTHPQTLPYRQVRQMCKERGIIFRRVKGKHFGTDEQESKGKTLLKGGSQLPYAKQAFSMRRERELDFSFKEDLRSGRLRKDDSDGSYLLDLDLDIYYAGSEHTESTTAWETESDSESARSNTSGSDASDTDADDALP